MRTAKLISASPDARIRIIDASVAVKWFAKETGSDAARRILRAAQSNELELFAPDLLLYEIGNALWKGKKLEASRVHEALFLVRSLPITLLALTAIRIGLITSLLEKYDLTFYDAAYAALALEFAAPLVSANPKDHRKIKEITVIAL